MTFILFLFFLLVLLKQFKPFCYFLLLFNALLILLFLDELFIFSLLLFSFLLAQFGIFLFFLKQLLFFSLHLLNKVDSLLFSHFFANFLIVLYLRFCQFLLSRELIPRPNILNEMAITWLLYLLVRLRLAFNFSSSADHYICFISYLPFIISSWNCLYLLKVKN